MQDRHATYSDALRRRVLDGDGSLSIEVRRALAAGAGVPDDLAAFATTVRDRAYQIADGEVAALVQAGYTEDQVYEATVVTALGAGVRRLDAGLAAIAASFAAHPEGQAPAPVAKADEPVDEPFTLIPAFDDAPPLQRRRPGANAPDGGPR